MSLAMAVLETPRSRKRRMSSSLPLSRETPNEPFGRPSFLPEDLALARRNDSAVNKLCAMTSDMCSLRNRTASLLKASPKGEGFHPPREWKVIDGAGRDGAVRTSG